MSPKLSVSKKKKISSKKSSVHFSSKKHTDNISEFIRMYVHFFKGNIWVFIALVILGIFIPPLLATAVIYFVYHSSTKRPRLFDRHIVIFFVVIFCYQLLARMFEGFAFKLVVERVLQTTALATLLFYPFVFFWLWFHYNYIKKQKDPEHK